MIYSSFQLLKNFKYLGQKSLSDGTLLIGKAPHIAPDGWLHAIYPALNENEIQNIEEKLQKRIPLDYREFLFTSNGLSIFNTTLSLYGLRKRNTRTLDDAWQPFNIITSNTIERPINANENVFIIGGYDWDGSYIYCDIKSQKVFFCSREDVTPLYEWKNFEDMLNSEIPRLIKLFDRAGKEIDSGRSTLPI